MALVPYYYQDEAIDETIKFLLNTTKHGTLWIPTSGGKSLIQAEIAKRVANIIPNYQQIMLTDVTALIGQNKDELLDQWSEANATVYSASYDQKKSQGRSCFLRYSVSLHKRSFV